MGRTAIVLLCATFLLGGGVPCAADDAGAVRVVADFDGGATSGTFQAFDTEAQLVADGAGDGQVLRWHQTPSDDGGWISVRGVPADVRPYRRLRLRVRCVGAYHDDAAVRIRSEDGSIGAYLEGLSEAWRTLEFLLPEMREHDSFDPTRVFRISLVCWDTKGFTLEIDDIALVEEGSGWRYSKEELQAWGVDLEGPVYRIGDFEDDRFLKRLKVVESTFERADAKPRRKGHCARWTVPKTGKTVWLTIGNLPKDIREYRLLRMSLRTRRTLVDTICVRLRGGDGTLSRALPALRKKVWNDVVIPLSTMGEEDEFDPEGVWGLRFVVWEPQGFVLDIDDIELVKGAGGWKMSPEERLAWLFGEKRKKKVKDIETDHFHVFSDSSAAKKKFPKALEKMHAFACRTLGLSEIRPDDRLDVFIFQNPELYFDFCVRRGWSREAATRTAGHAWSGFFATYYQSPSAPTVMHELTHSLFHRARGTGGGSWLQEGAAVCVEERWQKRDAATLFAPRLAAGQFMPLAELLTTDKLIRAHDVRGGEGTANALYQQAGALFEFLIRGPFAKLHPDAVAKLARLEWDEATVVKEVERIYETSLAEIETAWIEWGSTPPEIR